VGGGTHQAHPDKLKAIENLVFPATKRQMKSLLGLISYYRAYIPNLAEITCCLSDMVKKNQPIKLQPTSDALKAFEIVKEKLISAPVLRCPDFRKPFILQTDASNFAIGSCLSQVFEDGEEHPIAFASSKLSKTQIAWSTIEKESYAIVHALKKFDSFIYGREIHIVTDHDPLCYIVQAAPDNAKLTRWKLGIQRYNIVSIKHRKGVDHINCDALSRLFAED
jgi:hypothetical protein